MGKILHYLDRRLQGRSLLSLFKPSVTSKIEAIAENEDIEPDSWIMLQIARGMNEYWDFREGKPKEK